MSPRKIDLVELERWLGVGQAAEKLGRSRQHIHNLLAARELRGVRTSIGWLLDPESVEAEKRRQASAVEERL